MSDPELRVSAERETRLIPLIRRAILDPGSFNPYGERLDQWQDRAIAAALYQSNDKGGEG